MIARPSLALMVTLVLMSAGCENKEAKAAEQRRLAAEQRRREIQAKLPSGDWVYGKWNCSGTQSAIASREGYSSSSGSYLDLYFETGPAGTSAPTKGSIGSRFAGQLTIHSARPGKLDLVTMNDSGQRVSAGTVYWVDFEGSSKCTNIEDGRVLEAGFWGTPWCLRVWNEFRMATTDGMAVRFYYPVTGYRTDYRTVPRLDEQWREVNGFTRSDPKGLSCTRVE